MQIPVLIQFITMGTGWPRQSTFIAQGGLCSLSAVAHWKKECVHFL